MTCGRTPLLVTDIQIGREGVVINTNPDGSMQFTDSISGTVKLSDLVNQDVVINPATVVQIEQADWSPILLDDGRTFYTVEVPHNFAVTNLALVDVTLWDSLYNIMTIHNVQQKANSAQLTAAKALDMFVTLKKV